MSNRTFSRTRGCGLLTVGGEALHLKQPRFQMQAACESNEGPVRADYPMAGHDGRHGIALHHLPHGPGGSGPADSCGKFSVRYRLPIGNPRGLEQNLALKRRLCMQVQGKLECDTLTCVVCLQLLLRAVKQVLDGSGGPRIRCWRPRMRL